MPMTARAVVAAAVVSMAIPVLSAGPAEELEPEAKRFLDVFGLLSDRAAVPMEPAAAVYAGALPAMLWTLDPHSAFLTADQLESLREMQRSTEKGFGSVVNLLPGRVIVLQTLPDSPSARAGITPGDEILALNGQPLGQLPVEQLVAVLGRARQGRAQLMVRRPNFPNLLDMTMIPAEMADPSVSRQFLLAPGVAYAKILNFEAETAHELTVAVERLGGERLRGVVLDLRGNPGGIVEVAVQVAAYFLEPGDRILWVRGRTGPMEEVLVPDDARPYRFPVRILVDDRTASAAELVAGALQDHGRARVLGTRTFGKGLVQSVSELSGGTALALTTAFYLTPSKRPIQRWRGRCGQFQISPCNKGHSSQPDLGGIEPDRTMQPRTFTPLEQVLLASNSFLEFARDLVANGADVDESFEPSNPMLDEFQFYLSQRGIRPSLAEWSTTLDFIRAGLKQEALNLTLGVAVGDEFELRRDPVVRAALEEILSLHR